MATLQVAKLPSGKSILDVPDAFFTKSVFSTEGPEPAGSRRTSRCSSRTRATGGCSTSPRPQPRADGGAAPCARRRCPARRRRRRRDAGRRLDSLAVEEVESAMRNMAKSFRIAHAAESRARRRTTTASRSRAATEASGDSSSETVARSETTASPRVGVASLNECSMA